MAAVSVSDAVVEDAVMMVVVGFSLTVVVWFSFVVVNSLVVIVAVVVMGFTVPGVPGVCFSVDCK